MNIINVKVNFTRGTCETTGINLITGDYNSTKMVFQFDREDGTKIFEMKSPSEELVMVQEIENNEIVLYGLDDNEQVASLFKEDGSYIFEISLYENGSKLTSASGKLKVKPEQVVIDDEVVEAYLPVFDQLMAEINEAITETNNLDLDMDNTLGVVTATITKKDGTEKEVEIIDTTDYYTKDEVDSIKTTIEDEIPTKVSELDNDSEFIDKTVNNLTYYTLATGTGSSIELSINSSTYVMTLNLKNSVGTTISTGSIDLPLETMVVGATYDNTNKKIILTLKNGSTIDVPVGDLISGLQTEITNSNKLSSDLVDDTGHTNKFTTTSEKSTWSAKYDKPSGGIPKTDLASAVQTSLGKADTALQSHQDISGKEDKSNKVTSISGSSTDTQYPSAKCVYDSQVAQNTEIETLRSENDYLNSIIDQIVPKTTATGTSITLEDTLQAKMNMSLSPSELSQDGEPTPTTPYKIHTISGDNTIKIVGKNLGRETFDSKLYLTGSGDNRTAAERTSDVVGEIIKVKPSTSYTISGTFTDFGDSVLRFGEFTNIPIVGATSTKHYNTSNELVFTTQATTNYLLLYNTYNRNTTAPNLFVCETQYADTYEPYQEQIVQLNLPVENLLNVSDRTLNATGSDQYLVNNFALDNTETYTLSFNYTPNSPTFSSTGALIILVQDGGYSSLINTTDTSKKVEVTITNKSLLSLYVTSRLSGGSITISNVQLELGDKANSYTPFGTPVLEYSKIGNYKDVFVKPSGKNKLEYTLASLKTLNTGGTWNNNVYTHNGVSFTINDNGTILVNGTASTSTYLVLKNGLDLVNGEQYILNGCPSGGNVSTYSLRIYTGNDYESETGSGKSFTYGSQSLIRLNIFGNTSPSNLLFKPMIRLASVSDDSYEPYNNNKWYLKKNIGKVVFDGSESWIKSSTYPGNYYLQNAISNTIVANTNVLCNQTQNILEVSGDIANYDNCLFIENPVTLKTLDFKNANISTLEEFKASLGITNLILHYALEKSEYLPLNDTLQSQLDTIESMLLSYKQQTNISQINNDLPFIITSEALKEL